MGYADASEMSLQLPFPDVGLSLAAGSAGLAPATCGSMLIPTDMLRVFKAEAGHGEAASSLSFDAFFIIKGRVVYIFLKLIASGAGCDNARQVRPSALEAAWAPIAG